MHLPGIEIHRIVWHSHGGGAVKLDSGFGCTGLVRVNWQRRSVTVFQGWARETPVLHCTVGVWVQDGEEAAVGPGGAGEQGHWGGVY